ncbi:MAG: Ni/Fe-hydrogenase cytochrome b subunit, partial [Desulfobacterales bacterium]|nr:Ni/Fe-hydrogenase cytochrome b subunit [Desulfobacterales bacterium]MDX2510744.1 Ni/Fe-hydrogenase cytochrome b subunit [Desulfobacterales bacterium]
MNTHETAAPVEEKFLTPGVMVMMALMVIGGAFVLARFIYGIGTVSNLNNQYPWGIWIGIDVASGVALAAGGFTTGAIAYVFNRDQYHAVIRPALLTAMLGYTFVVLGLLVDVGRYWNITSPIFNHNGNSVLFEVAICVMIYLHVLYIEFIPIVVERFRGRVNLPGVLSRLNTLIETLLGIADKILGKIMFIFIIAGIVLSCLHQSSLGSLMLIAPYKVHPLWYTPILPLLFLLSAFAAGYPMVTFESILVSKSFGREPEMSVLTPLAKYIPVFMGTYLVFKIGDMIVRKSYVYLLDGTYQTNAFLVELGVGVILPFLLLLFRRVRRSPGWLFFASTIFILGILLNRINVFVVSYTPPYKIVSYFPALGEIFITVGLIATLMFVYRVAVFIFPVLGAHPKKMSPVLIAILAVGVALMIQGVTSQAEAGQLTKSILPLEKDITPSIADAPKVQILDSPIINKYSDLYEPVRFMHSKHANVLGECTICHHRTPRDESDTYGEPLSMVELRKRKMEPVACSSCHSDPFNVKDLGTPGLKGAYHQLCMDCHQESEQVPHTRGPILYSAMVRGPMVRTLDTRAPTDCLACHAKKVPNHNQLVKLEGKVDALAVTQNCLSCHEKEGKAILKTVHWNWHGPSPYTVGHEKRVDLGKNHATINNFCINLNGNWARCTSCHIGYGWKDGDFDFNDMAAIDCLVCHDTTGKYRKAPPAAGFPEKNLDLAAIAQNVGRPSRSTCGINCHFRGGGGDAVKHGDMSSILVKPDKSHDVHMGITGGGLDFRCQDCHKTRNHMISGRSISVPAVEGDLSCEYCHTDSPHVGAELIDHHLNKHTRHVACQTCHIPVYSKGNPTKVYWDWSTAGKDIKKPKDKYGKPVYQKKKGSFEWKEAAKPTYKWYNGTVKRYLLGDRINDNGVTNLTMPVGDISDPASRIYPFKLHKGKQISDAVYKYLIAPKLWQGYWEHWDWDKASQDGMKAANLAYSGAYEFVETAMYWGLTHEVVPKEQALSCAECHASLSKAPYCGKCHQNRPDVSFEALVKKGVDFKHMAEMGRDVKDLIGKTNYIDYKALGYEGDTIEV